MKKQVRLPNASDGGVPELKHLEEPLSETLDICISENEIQKEISDYLLKLWNLEQSQNISLRNLLEQTEKLVSKSLLAPSDDVSRYFFGGDTFDNESNIDSTSTVLLDKEAGYVILPIVEIESLNKYIGQIKILSESEGRPGDVASIKALSYDKNGNPLPQIVNDPKENVLEAFDNRPDTWFTWEKLFVKRNQKVKRTGPSNALISDTNGKEEDILKSINSFGIKWKGIIPGQGEVEKDIYTFYNNSSEISKKTKLIIEVKFTAPVPLSTIRITPLIEYLIPEPKVTSIQVYDELGGIAVPPGLPRRITSLSGKEISIKKATNLSVNKANFSGSGIFQVKTERSFASSVRIELTADSVVLPLGVIHPFKVKNTETSEKTFVLGIKTSGKTKRGQERVEPVTQWTSLERFEGMKSQLSGLLGDILTNVSIYQQSKRNTFNPTVPKEINISDLKVLKTKDQSLNNLVNNKAQNIVADRVGNTVNILNQAARDSRSLQTALGKSLVTKLALGGPVGIIVSAALAGTLFNKKKTVNVTENESSDIFEAERAAIMIRDIVFDNRVYSDSADLFSEIITLPGEARAVSLNIQLEVPDSWPKGPWVSAQIKPIYDSEEGEWIPIKPNGTCWSEDPNNEIVSLNKPTSKVKVRINLQRPQGFEYQNQSPILTSYVIKGLPV